VRASEKANEIPENERSLSEQFRIVAKRWVDLDGAARMLEEMKTATLSEMIGQKGDMSHNKAEREVKASPEWKEFVTSMVNARTSANMAKYQLKYIEMQHWEWQQKNATRRSEMQMSRG
jgi:hypothetical protein